MEETFVLIKPDGIQRKNIGQIIQRLEGKGLQLKAMKMLWLTPPQVEELYPHLKDKEFFPRLTNFMVAAPVIVMVWAGEEAISATRKLLGATNPQEASTGTIRGDWAMAVGANLVHGSDSPATARREIEQFFSQEEIMEYEQAGENWLKEEPWQ